MVEKNVAAIRRDYGDSSLSVENAHESPFIQFQHWFDEVVALKTVDDPTAMVLSTVDTYGHPNSRVVLLKEITDDGFVFYTNYQSQKAKEIEACSYVALNFFWGILARQVRVRGKIEKVSSEVSDQYFSSRPLMSQLSAIASPQSAVITSRAFLEGALDALIRDISEDIDSQQLSLRGGAHQQGEGVYAQCMTEAERVCNIAENSSVKSIVHVSRPSTWGGYRVLPDEIEFWQGGTNRLHHRVRYIRQNNAWKRELLAP